MDSTDRRKAFGEAVRKRRQRQRLSQRDLADMVATSQGYLWQIEAGKANPSLDMVCKIADALGCSVGNLIDF